MSTVLKLQRPNPRRLRTCADLDRCMSQEQQLSTNLLLLQSTHQLPSLTECRLSFRCPCDAKRRNQSLFFISSDGESSSHPARDQMVVRTPLGSFSRANPAHLHQTPPLGRSTLSLSLSLLTHFLSLVLFSIVFSATVDCLSLSQI